MYHQTACQQEIGQFTKISSSIHLNIIIKIAMFYQPEDLPLNFSICPWICESLQKKSMLNILCRDNTSGRIIFILLLEGFIMDPGSYFSSRE